MSRGEEAENNRSLSKMPTPSNRAAAAASNFSVSGPLRQTVAIDLRNDWPKALCDKGFNAKQPTAWIAEGLLIYLPPEAQDLLFDRINDLSAPGSRVACEHIPDVSMFSDERSQLILVRLKKYGHDFEMRDLIYHEKRNNVVDYLTGHGWDVTVRKVPDAYADNGFEFPEDGAMGFFTEMKR